LERLARDEHSIKSKRKPLFILNLQVTFSNPVEAESAMTSPDAVMGNRFIKVFYHHESKTATVVPLKERVGTKASRIRPAQCKQTKNDVFHGAG